MLHKVFKQLKKQEHSPEKKPGVYSSQKLTPVQAKKGFHAKKNSTKGAARQRSIGNRNTKSA